MILFMNVFITDQRHVTFVPYNRGLCPAPSPYDVFKYCLGSLTVIPWSRVIVYCQLDANYYHNADDLRVYFQSLFPDGSLYLYRNMFQQQWQASLTEVMDHSDPLVWFMCNHDHIFVDYDLSVLNSITDDMKNRMEKDKYVACYFSHWPEMLDRLPSKAEHCPTHCVFTDPDNDSIMIVNKEVLSRWWWENHYGATFIARTDHLVERFPLSLFIPMRELCRHFDGYDRGDRMHQNINKCPPLNIPLGWFEKDMKVSYGQDMPGHLYIDPRNPNYRCVVPTGSDMKCLLSDLPLFWRDRISAVKVSAEPDPASRLQAIYDLAHATESGRTFPTKEELGSAWTTSL